MTTATPVVVPAVPPRPPQVTLLGSSQIPNSVTEPSISAPTAEQLAALPADLRAELDARKGEMWVRGFTYAPEQHSSCWLRDPYDGTTWDFESLPVPSGLAVANSPGGGTLTAVSHSYQVTAVNAAGETTPCGLVAVTNTAGSASILTWNGVADGEGSTAYTYKVYGRVAGSIGLLATVGPFVDGVQPTYTDTGAATVGAAPPSTNSTGGPGTYTNLPSPLIVPYLIEAMDTCSAFGWEARDPKGRAARWLENGTPQALESEFWNGTWTQAKGKTNPYLCNTATVTNLTPGSTTVTNGTPCSISRGYQILQDALAQTGFGGQGMIHCQPQTAPSLLGSRRNGALLLDIFDNIVVPGVGYSGYGPGNVAPNANCAWIYASDLVSCRVQDEVTIFPDTYAEALDRGQAGEPNTITFRAEKYGVAYFDVAAHFAVQVTLPS